MIEAHRKTQQGFEAEAVTRDREVVAQVSATRIAKGKPGLTPEQEASMLERLAGRRVHGN
jgi:chorismate mutase